jgi:hypothetical protein
MPDSSTTITVQGIHFLLDNDSRLAQNPRNLAPLSTRQSGPLKSEAEFS